MCACVQVCTSDDVPSTYPSQLINEKKRWRMNEGDDDNCYDAHKDFMNEL